MNVNRILVGLVGAAALLCAGCASPGEAPSTREFEVRHELKVKVPEGAQKVRVWFALPHWYLLEPHRSELSHLLPRHRSPYSS